MSAQQDLERAWLAKFSSCLDKVVGEKVRKEVMRGSDDLSSLSSRQEVIGWSKGAMERLDSLVDEEQAQEIMTGCACQYPKSALQAVRERYKVTGDIDSAHQMLQEQFESLLRDSLQLSDGLVEEIVKRGWGSAGIKQGNTIIATKIPESGSLVEYMNEADPEKKRQHYCHCPRIREVLKTSETLSPTYCYCGAGFYRGIWEGILQQPVKVKVLESVLHGGEVCKIAIHLP
jgi:hypothetical protein